MKIIPIFLPYAGCKHRCVFCDQVGSTGESRRPRPDEIDSKVMEYLKTGSDYELAFYGGTFTGLPIEVQMEYLKTVSKWLGKGISSIRISTRPDEIDEEVAEILKEHGVEVVEIGAQSMFDDVLEASKRGHSSEDVLRAVEILKKFGFRIGIHLMAGLPKSTPEKDVESARMVSELGIETARIHPTIVFRGTELEKMMKRGDYVPLTLEEAVRISSAMLAVLEGNGVKVIRIGLHVPVELRKNISAGPYHPSFGDMVRARSVRDIVETLEISEIEVDKKHEGWVYGYGNREFFEKMGVKIFRGESFRFDGMEYEKALKEMSEVRRWTGLRS